MSKLSYFLNKQQNNKKECVRSIFDQLKEGDVILSISLFIFHLISFSSYFIDHGSFLFSLVHNPSHSFHLSLFISSIFILFGRIDITWSFNVIVSFTFHPIPSLEINNLRVLLEKFSILYRYSLPEAELRWFYYSLPLYIEQESRNYCTKYPCYWFVCWRFLYDLSFDLCWKKCWCQQNSLCVKFHHFRIWVTQEGSFFALPPSVRSPEKAHPE